MKLTGLIGIDYDDFYYLSRLTFIFTGGIRSPPTGTYFSEPPNEYEVPKTKQLGSMVFATNRFFSEFGLVSLKLMDTDKNVIKELKGHKEQDDKQITLVAGGAQKIVAVKVTTEFNNPVNLQFIFWIDKT